MDGISIQVEARRKLGLPSAVLALVGLKPGDRVVVQARRDRRLVITPMDDLIEKYNGAVPGLAATADLPEQRAE